MSNKRKKSIKKKVDKQRVLLYILYCASYNITTKDMCFYMYLLQYSMGDVGLFFKVQNNIFRCEELYRLIDKIADNGYINVLSTNYAITRKGMEVLDGYCDTVKELNLFEDRLQYLTNLDEDSLFRLAITCALMEEYSNSSTGEDLLRLKNNIIDSIRYYITLDESDFYENIRVIRCMKKKEYLIRGKESESED